MTATRSQNAVHYLRLALLGAAIAGLADVLFEAVTNYAILTRQPCQNGVEPLGVPTSGYFVFGSLGAFCLGGLLGRWRHFSGLVIREDPVEHDWTRVVVQVVLTAFFTLAVVLLAYETWAEWDPATRWPITAFVRCADHNHTLHALGTTGAVSFLLGNWLWHPGRTADVDSGR